MDFFLGEFDYKVDAHNRLSIPSQFRQLMADMQESNFVISKAQKDYIILYPCKIWKESVGDKIAKLPRHDAKANRLRRLVGLQSKKIPMDTQGRVNIPEDYTKHVNIDKKIKIIGTLDTIQLWNPDTYELISQTPEEQSALEEYKEFGI